LVTLHREREGATGGDRVEAELVAGPRRGEQALRIFDAAQRPERELGLVLEALTAITMITADRAAGATVPRVPGDGAEALRREAPRGRLADRDALKIAGRQDLQAVEGLEVAGGAEAPILVGADALAARGEFAGPGDHAVRLGDAGDRGATHGDRLDTLGP